MSEESFVRKSGWTYTVRTVVGFTVNSSGRCKVGQHDNKVYMHSMTTTHMLVNLYVCFNYDK